MASIFSRIVAGEIPCYKIAEDEQYFAFLDISPLQKGHTLVIPKREVDYIFDLSDDELAGLQVFAKKVAIAIRKAIPARLLPFCHCVLSFTLLAEVYAVSAAEKKAESATHTSSASARTPIVGVMES